MSVYMLYAGVPGNATAEKYKQYVRIDSMQFGVGRGITMEVGNLANRESTKPSISEITCTTEVDKCLTALFKEAVAGTTGKDVKFSIVQTAADGLFEYMTIDLTSALVSGWSFSIENESKGYLTFSLSFAAIEITYADFDDTNKGGSPIRTSFDLKTVKAS